MDQPAAVVLCLALHGAALAYVLGDLALREGLRSTAPAGRQRFAALALALATAVAWPFLVTAAVLDDPAAALDHAQVARVLTQTSFGRVWLLRSGLVAVAFVLAAAGRNRPLLLVSAVAPALASLAWIGHAAGASATVRGATALHLLAVGAWVGALPGLLGAARRLPSEELAALLRRFSSLGVLLVAGVLGTGCLIAATRIGAPAGWAGSTYVRLLGAKLSLVAAMGVCALRNRNRYTPALTVPEADPDATRRALRHCIGTEAALGGAVVLMAFVLGATEPPA